MKRPVKENLPICPTGYRTCMEQKDYHVVLWAAIALQGMGTVVGFSSTAPSSGSRSTFPAS